MNAWAWDASTRPRPPRLRGFTLIEMLLVMAIVATLVALATPRLTAVIERARVTRAIGDIRAMQSVIDGSNPPPMTLAQAGYGNKLDPWGRPYVYNPFLARGRPGSSRRDRFLVPLNSEYDLYSVGRDGLSRTPLDVPVSRDDVIRANDGGFIGLASRY